MRSAVKSFLVVLSLIVAPPMQADILDVSDMALLHQLVLQYQRLAEQLQQMQSIKKNLQGNYHIAALVKEHINDDMTSGDWERELKQLSGGNPYRLAALKQAYARYSHLPDQNVIQQHTSVRNSQQFQQQSAVNQAAYVNASAVFADINKHMENVHTLSASIDSAANAKASMDINSRLLAELTYIQLQELKMQSIMNQQMVQREQDIMSSEAQSTHFFSMPNQ